MRLDSVRIEKYRCFSDITVSFDDLTVLVGSNGSGKSTVLRAIDWFFNGGQLGGDDVHRHEEGATVRVSAQFSAFTDADRVALGAYAGGETAIFTRIWSSDAGEKLTGHAFKFPPFETIRGLDGAVPRRQAFNAFAEENTDLGLEKAANQAEVDANMTAFEQANPDLLEQTEADATHLFGFVGSAKLNGRMAFVFVPADSDADEELGGARGSLLTRLMERLPQSDEIATRLGALQAETQVQAEEMLRAHHGDNVTAISERITTALREFVPDADVEVRVQPPVVRLTEAAFDVQVADDGVPTDVAHQGHGFQRALVIATLHELARVQDEGDVPSVFLGIEEPELYQHPVQARHFASVLAALPREGEGAFQVAYATHSAFFVDPTKYEQLRRFSRRRDDGKREVTCATIEGVASRLDGIVAAADIPSRISLTLRRTLGEAVFADSVLLVEGSSDAGLFNGVADRSGGLESRGVAVVNAEGKTVLATALAILAELGVPTFVVFDADRGLAERMEADGRKPDDVTRATAEAARWNRVLLRLIGAEEVDWPDTEVQATWAVAENDLETLWPAAIEHARQLADAAGDSRRKPEEWYREAAAAIGAEPPDVLRSIVECVVALR